MVVADGLPLGSFLRVEFVHETLDDAGQVVAGIFPGEKCFDLCGHSRLEGMLCLTLILHERLENFCGIHPPIQNFVSAVGRGMFHNGVLRCPGCRVMAQAGVIEKRNAPVPGRAVGGLDGISVCRFLSVHTGAQSRPGRVPFKLLRGVTIGHIPLQVLDELSDGFHVGPVFQFAWLIVAHGQIIRALGIQITRRPGRATCLVELGRF